MIKYIVSQHKLFAINGRAFLFLPNENAIFEADRETRELLDQLSGKKGLTEKAIMAHLKIPDEEKEQLFQELISQKILLAADKKIPDHQRFEVEPIILPVNTLVLHVTDACNLGCLYCYHSSSKKANQRKRTMTVEVAEQAIDFLYDQAKDLPEVGLVFFGGEPILNFKLISKAVQHALEKSETTGKKISLTLTTNGTLLSEEVISFLHNHQIGVTVSIDGLEIIHNKYRPFPDGSPSYRTILKNIENLFRIYNGVPVPARVTVAGSSENIPDTLDHLLNLGFAEVGFAPVTTDDIASQLNNQEMDQMLKQFQILSQQFLEAALDDRLLGFSNLIDLLLVLHEGEVKNYPCGAGLGLFSVDPDGDLFLCQRLTGEEAFLMGDIFSGLSTAKVNAFRKRAAITQKETCIHCWVRNICAGGCYHEALVREGDIMKPNLHYCQWIKEWVATGIEVYGQLAAIRPEFLDRLSLLRAN